MSLNRLLAVLAAAVLYAQPTLATVVIQPIGITSSFSANLGSIDNLIDKSGLEPSPGYVNGDPYSVILGPPIVTHASFTAGDAFQSTTLRGFFDLELDKPYLLTDFALWNGPASFGIDDFNLSVSMDNVFEPSEQVLSTTALAGPNAQSFSFAQTQGMFVRVDVTSSKSPNNVLVGEFALGGTMGPTTVPEPATAVLFCLGLAGLGFRRLRRT